MCNWQSLEQASERSTQLIKMQIKNKYWCTILANHGIDNFFDIYLKGIVESHFLAEKGNLKMNKVISKTGINDSQDANNNDTVNELFIVDKKYQNSDDAD